MKILDVIMESFQKEKFVSGREESPKQLESAITEAGHIALAFKEAGGRALIAGGFARDEAIRRILGRPIEGKDIDIEVYGLQAEEIQKVLKKFGKVKQAGESFPVFKIRDYDISLPRRESKTGPKHQDFLVEGDPFMSVKEAARRRDFTINALALDPITGEFVDEWGGLEDIKNRKLRAIDAELFKDDSLRALRAMQFADRFEFEITPETIELCRNLPLENLSKERIGEEWNKMMLKSAKPSIGLDAARYLGIIDKLHPELKAIFDVPQDPEWHPEGDVWRHTKLVLNKMAERIRLDKIDDEDKKLTLLYSALCHDLGKAATTKFEDGRLRSKGHAEASLKQAEQFLNSLHPQNVNQNIIKGVLKLIKNHLFIGTNYDKEKDELKISDKKLRSKAKELEPLSLVDLERISRADNCGRLYEDQRFRAGELFLERAEKLKVLDELLPYILGGKDLIELGLKPGILFGEILKEIYDKQLNGEIKTKEEAIEFVKENFIR